MWPQVFPLGEHQRRIWTGASLPTGPTALPDRDRSQPFHWAHSTTRPGQEPAFPLGPQHYQTGTGRSQPSHSVNSIFRPGQEPAFPLGHSTTRRDRSQPSHWAHSTSRLGQEPACPLGQQYYQTGTGASLSIQSTAFSDRVRSQPPQWGTALPDRSQPSHWAHSTPRPGPEPACPLAPQHFLTGTRLPTGPTALPDRDRSQPFHWAHSTF